MARSSRVAEIVKILRVISLILTAIANGYNKEANLGINDLNGLIDDLEQFNDNR